MNEPKQLQRADADYYMSLPNDEIDLFELAHDVFVHKWWVVISVVFCVLLAVAYLLVATPTYKTSAVITIPTARNLAPLDVPGTKYRIKPDAALELVARQLGSQQSRLAYWKQNKQLFGELLAKPGGTTDEHRLRAYDKNNFSLSLPEDDKDSQGNVSFSLTYPEGVNGVKLATGLLHHAIDMANTRIVNAWQVERITRIASLQYAIKQKYVDYRADLKQQESKLEDAIAVAKSLGITTPATMQALAARESGGSQSALATATTGKLPLYLMGTRALGSQLETLEQRPYEKPDPAKLFADLPQDRYIKGMASLKYQARYLTNLKPDFTKLEAAQVIQQPATPSHAEKPCKKLILALAIIVGGGIGVLLALLRAAWRKREFASRPLTEDTAQ